MKKLIYLISILFLFSYCGPERQKIERFMEDGVEVVVNHLEPYKIKGEPSALHLEEEFMIDTEKDEIAQLGVTDIRAFDVDSEGNIYFFQERESDKNLVYKFDKYGHFVTPFGKRGQGPGEVQIPVYLNITRQDEIPIQDYGGFKLYVFDGNGTIIKETCLDSKSAGFFAFYPLENGNYLKFRDYFDPSIKHRYDILELYNSKLEEIKELDRCDYGLLGRIAQKVKGTPRVFIIEASDGMIYLGHENRGYEVLIYDMDGKLLRKIRKEYRPADAPDEFKKILIANFELVKDKLIIPDIMPPFHYFFLDDEGRLYVKTYEKGDNKNECIHDVFNSDGIFITRVSLPGYGSWMYPGRDLNRAKAKNKRLYCIREKESGYKELAVYRMIWEKGAGS
jgi:hypothetical protein